MKFGLLLFLLVFSVTAFSQSDTSAIDPQLEDLFDIDEQVTLPPNSGKADSSVVAARPFNESTLDDLRQDSDLQYKEPPTIGENFFERFWRWLGELLGSIFRNATYTDWGRVVSFILGIAVLVLVIMMILKIDAFKVFYSGEGANKLQYNVLDENIHEIDFETEIQKALDMNDQRRAVRLVFLYALKILSDKQYINWEQGKTNHEYVRELKDENLRPGFDQLSYYFDYAWYGNFHVTREVFDQVNGVFKDWKRKAG